MASKKCLKCKGVGHPMCGLHDYAIVILGVGESKVLTCREKTIKRDEEGGRERQQMNGRIMIQNQRAKEAVTWWEGCRVAL